MSLSSVNNVINIPPVHSEVIRRVKGNGGLMWPGMLAIRAPLASNSDARAGTVRVRGLSDRHGC